MNLQYTNLNRLDVQRGELYVRGLGPLVASSLRLDTTAQWASSVRSDATPQGP